MALGAVLDTCVLVPAALRDTLLRAAEADLYQLHLSGEILHELERVLVRQELTSETGSRYLVSEIRTAFDQAITPPSYQRLIPFMPVNEKDWHVLAAAIHTQAQIIVTENLQDFPDEYCSPFGVEAQHPDAFLLDLFDLDPDLLCLLIQEQADALQRDQMTLERVLSSISHRAPQFADAVRSRVTRRDNT